MLMPQLLHINHGIRSPIAFFLLIMSAGVWERTQRVEGVLFIFFFYENIFNFFFASLTFKTTPSPCCLGVGSTIF